MILVIRLSRLLFILYHRRGDDALSSDDMEALVEHREKLDAELEQLRENWMELEAEIEGKESVLNIIDKIIEKTGVSC